MWYRKLSPDATKTPKKKSRDRKKPGGKSADDSDGKPTTQKDEVAAKKVSIKSL